MANSNDVAESFFELPSGDALTPAEANQTTRSSVTRVIIPVGLAGVGKTTLLAEIYEKFLEGPFADHRYAWSQTLHGFEQRVHSARIASGRRTPTTPRTPITDRDKFLHLRLAPVDGLTQPRDVLIADCPGEVFRLMRDDVREAKSHPLLLRADHIAFLVNGESFGKLDLRQEAYHETDLLIQSILDAGVDRAVTSVIYTKWDAAGKSDGADRLDGFVSKFEEDLRRKHGTRLGELRFIKTAARPDRGSALDRGWNLDEVLRIWLGSARRPMLVEGSVFPSIKAVREFDRFRSAGSQRVQ